MVDLALKVHSKFFVSVNFELFFPKLYFAPILKKKMLANFFSSIFLESSEKHFNLVASKIRA